MACRILLLKLHRADVIEPPPPQRPANKSFAYERNEEKIRAEAALDGLYVIRSSVDKTRMGDQELVANYKNLEMVERAFRSLKSIDLNVRPIYHRLGSRVRAHIFICMLAYHIEHQMRQLLAPLLFADEQKETVAERDSVVAPAKRSASAQEKDQTRRTPDGQYPISSFRDIIQTLSAITRSRVEVKGHKKGDFKTTSTPSPYQRKILELHWACARVVASSWKSGFLQPAHSRTDAHIHAKKFGLTVLDKYVAFGSGQKGS